MKFSETTLDGVLIIEPAAFEDERGYFMETLRVDRLQEHGIDRPFVQENQSGSQRGTLRGLHFQLQRPQAKLCRVVSGEVLDVAVDIRRKSPSFGRHVSVLLSASNRKQMYIPRDFAHGFIVLSQFAEFLYKCDDYYDPDDQNGIAWSDPDIAIDWTMETGLVLSKKDMCNPELASLPPEKLPDYQG